jgi:hypothetical protein
VSVVIGEITHLMFHGIGVADSTACGLIVGEEDPRGERDADCMACITWGIQPGVWEIGAEHIPNKYIPGKHSETFQLTRVD